MLAINHTENGWLLAQCVLLSKTFYLWLPHEDTCKLSKL